MKWKVLLLLFVCFTSSNCAKNIQPTTVVAHYASYDPKDVLGKPTSGILDFAPGGGRLVSFNVYNRYNSLVDSYGDQFQPPLKKDDGIIRNEKGWVIDRAHYVQYLQMVQWQRNGRPPKKKSLIKRIIGYNKPQPSPTPCSIG